MHLNGFSGFDQVWLLLILVYSSVDNIAQCSLISTLTKILCTVYEFEAVFLTYLCHVKAVLLGSVVPVGSDGSHIHAVELPYRGVDAVEVAAVGTARHVVRALVFGPLAAKTVNTGIQRYV